MRTPRRILQSQVDFRPRRVEPRYCGIIAADVGACSGLWHSPSLGRDEPVPDLLVSNGSLGQILVAGELDCATTSQIDDAFAGLSGEVVVDCRDVTFIDSAGFHALDRGYEAATKRGATFVVTGLSGFQTRIAKFLEIPYVLSSTDRERAPKPAGTPVSCATSMRTESSL